VAVDRDAACEHESAVVLAAFNNFIEEPSLRQKIVRIIIMTAEWRHAFSRVCSEVEHCVERSIEQRRRQVARVLLVELDLCWDRLPITA